MLTTNFEEADGLGITFENKKFVDIPQQFFALLPQVNFPANNLNFQRK